MRIIFVRHGEPDYARDTLTEKGKLQAAAVAERLKDEGIEEIYASPMGRAQLTASYTSKLLGLPVTTLDFMHEISWGGKPRDGVDADIPKYLEMASGKGEIHFENAIDIPENGHPWTLGDRMLESGFDFFKDDWREHPYFKCNIATDFYDFVSGKFDEFLKERGYTQEGNRFYCSAKENKTIAVFSHGGSGGCVLAKLLNLPFPYVAVVMPYEVTSVISVDIPFDPGNYVHGRLEIFNDVGHIKNIGSGLTIQSV
ncbi:MAG: phosphoglycerate mutase family protein [Lachnospiraceae bacterium]|nr:phosphoglycerate mutase family protein [Lachnospiraceae bacterium]